jgi:apolipoprotein N-acyltransferase
MSAFQHFSHPVIRSFSYLRCLTSWRRNAASFFLGVLATLTLAPFFLFPLIIPAYGGLLWLVQAAPTRRRAFLDGWWWGWGFYMSGLYWFCIALLTDAEKFAWLIPFALFGLTAVIALYSAAACWLMKATRVRGLGGIFVFSVLWTVVEFARGHWFSGFPWNLAGYSFAFSDSALQMASLLGAYGLTWLTVLLGASVTGLGEKGGKLFALVVWGVFALGVLWGAWRLGQAQTEYVEGVKLRIVQANIAQPHKWDPKRQMQGLQEHVRLTQSPGLNSITHVIWPETAVPYALKPDTSLTRMLGSAVPEGTILITGALRAQRADDKLQLWNSMVALNHAGAVVGSYDKVKLVPFGEFLPFRSLLPAAWLTPVGDIDFSSGPRGQVLDWPGLPPVMPLICYEAIFPGWVAHADKAPDWQLNLTNDAWFGLSSGPHQHFTMARMRAAEEGVPLVRAANTGISAIIDGYGRVLSELELGTQGVLDSKLPKRQNAYTVYAKYNTVIVLFLLGMAGAIIIRQRKAQNN